MRYELNVQPEAFEAYEAYNESESFETGAARRPYPPGRPRPGGAPAPTANPCAGLRQPEVLSKFGFDKQNLTPQHAAQIKRIARCIVASQRTRRPVRGLRLVGHTDPVGTDQYNLGLGRRRAAAAAAALKREIDRLRPGLWARLRPVVQTRGEQVPIPGNAPASRRVEVFLRFAATPGPGPRPGPGPSPPLPPPQPQPPVRSQCRFRPSLHGFKFVNSFTLPAVITSALSRLGVPIGSGPYGLCGGMSFLAADHFAFGVPIPAISSVPATGGALHRKLISRQIDSLNLNLGSIGPSFGGPVLKFFAWMRLPDRGSGSVAALTATELRAALPGLRGGRRMVLGLVRKSARTGSITDNHQVLAHCVTDLSPTQFQIHIYDPNFPGRDDARLDVRLVGGEALTMHVVPGALSEAVRGVFVMPYTPVRP